MKQNISKANPLLLHVPLPTPAGTFSGQPITPRDMAELKQRLEHEGSSIAPKSARSRGGASSTSCKQQQPGSKDASAGGSAALPPLRTPAGPGSVSSVSSSCWGSAVGVPVLRVAPAEEPAEGEVEDVDMLQVRTGWRSPC
jgi:hypothetical protein